MPARRPPPVIADLNDHALRDDPEPMPPVQPELEDCCGGGCAPCIFDIYEDARERYRRELAEWQARQVARAAGQG